MPIFQLGAEPIFPPPEMAEPDGLLAVGGDLSVERILRAYCQGIFPWYGPDTHILWWAPDPRLVLFPKNIHVSHRLARTLRANIFTVTADQAFSLVIAACAAPRRSGPETWLNADMRAAYIQLHKLGYAHSVECWQDGVLAGGFYGLALDKVFFGESMFSRQNNASKVALAAFTQETKRLGIELIDCQVTSEHLISLGAEEISGAAFQRLLKQLIGPAAPQGKWSFSEKTH